MVAVRFAVGLIWVLAFLAGRHMWDAALPTPPGPTVYGASPIVGIENTEPRPQLDVRGNQVDPAVADYRVDAVGDLYEQHAPGLALLKLGTPET